MLKRALLVILLPALGQLLPAQCTPVPNTGCTNATPPSCNGSPQIGNVLNLNCPPTAAMPFFIVGTAFTSPIAVPTQVTCNNAACTLACNPLVVVTGAALNLRIPNDPTLVGFDLCVQCVDVQPSQNCVTLSQALSIMILP